MGKSGALWKENNPTQLIWRSIASMSEETKVNMVYSGTFERSMDDKNRLTIPPNWLREGENEFQCIPNPKNEFLILMPPEEFASIGKKIEATNHSSMEKRKAIRQFYSLAHAISVDKHKRALLPAHHCQKVHLSSEIILIGSNSRFEIWNRDRWQESQKAEFKVYEAIAEEIGL